MVILALVLYVSYANEMLFLLYYEFELYLLTSVSAQYVLIGRPRERDAITVESTCVTLLFSTEPSASTTCPMLSTNTLNLALKSHPKDWSGRESNCF